MPNDRLREALASAGLTYADAATQVGVDPKTVERWVTNPRRAPYAKHRNAMAALLRESETYLWPNALSDDRRNEASESEVVHVYPKRSAVPNELWLKMLQRPAELVEILVYAGLFLPELAAEVPDLLTEKAEAGARVRILIADPDSDVVLRRGEEEGIGDALAARVRNSLTYFRSPDHDELAIRLHSTTLYNSIFRFDDDMLVSCHAIGVAGAHAPVLHLRRIGGGEMFETYRQAFERVWATAEERVA